MSRTDWRNKDDGEVENALKNTHVENKPVLEIIPILNHPLKYAFEIIFNRCILY